MHGGTARTTPFHPRRKSCHYRLEMVKIAWELLTTFNCCQLLSSSGVGQWGRRSPGRQAVITACASPPARCNRGCGFDAGSLQARSASPAVDLLLGPSSVVPFRGVVQTRLGWRSWGIASPVESGCCMQTWGHRSARGGLCAWDRPFGASPKNENPLLETFQSHHELSLPPSCLLPALQSTSPSGSPMATSARPQKEG